MPFLKYEILNNAIFEYFIALFIFSAVFILLRVSKRIVIGRLERLSQKTKTDIDDLLISIISSLKTFLYFFISLYIAIRFLDFPEIVFRALNYFLFFVIVYYAVKAIQSLIDYGVVKLIEKKEGIDRAIVELLARIIKGVLWAVALIIVLQNLGYDITALVAGLGIGGIAIAFALQNILVDLFASFAIYFDKPFEVDDFIIIGEDMGTVKKIGIKSTRIQALQGEELVVSNKELTEARIHNYKKMEKRRIVFSFGVIYETETDKLKQIPSVVKEIIDEIEKTDLDRVHFKDFGESALNYEVVYYLNSSDYNEYMDIQQDINLKIKERFEQQEIEMAYPTQTIFVKK